MAITIHSNPLTYTPSDNPVFWEFSSNQTGQENFSFYIEVFVNAILKTTAMLLPRTGGKAVYDATNIARISCNATSPISTITGDASNNATIYIKIYERYGSSPALQSSVTSNTVTVFKACLKPEDFIHFNNANYVWGTDPAVKRFLNVFPRDKRMKCGLTENMFLSFITNNQANLKYKIDLRDEDNDSIVVADVTLATTPKIITLNCSPANIIANTAITTGEFEQAAFYRVWITNSAETKNTEVISIDIDRECSPYEKNRFYFLNKYGAIDAFTFNRRRIQRTEVERKTYLKNLGYWNSSNSYAIDNTSRLINYQNYSHDNEQIFSDWMEQDVQNWLVTELYESTKVMVLRDGVYINVSITQTAYEKKTEDVELIREEVNFNLGNYRTAPLI